MEVLTRHVGISRTQPIKVPLLCYYSMTHFISRRESTLQGLNVRGPRQYKLDYPRSALGQPRPFKDSTSEVLDNTGSTFQGPPLVSLTLQGLNVRGPRQHRLNYPRYALGQPRPFKDSTSRVLDITSLITNSSPQGLIIRGYRYRKKK